MSGRPALAVLALVLLAGPVGADAPARLVQYADDKLTVHVSGVPLGELLDDVARQAGAEVRGGLRTPRDVTAEFDAVPLPEALHRLLGDQNFALVYGEGGTLRAVKLLGGPQAPTGLAALATKGGPPTTVPVKAYDTTGNLLNLVAAHPPIPLSGRLAAALGQEATIQQILETGLHSDDPALRGEAVKQTVALLEADAVLRGAVLGAVNGIDDAELATLLRGASPGHAEELAVHIVTQTHMNELRVKASGVLQQLRAPKSGG